MKKSFKKALILMLSFFLLVLSPDVTAFSDTTSAESPEIEDSKSAPSFNNLNNNYPIIMVHGLFGWGNDEKTAF